MGDLTKNFSKAEFACPCCGEVRVDLRLAAGLQLLRDAMGGPLRILSGYRCSSHNAAVGGAKDSLHRLGKAADLAGFAPELLARRAQDVPVFAVGGIGWGPGRCHVDVRGIGPGRWCYGVGGRILPWRKP